MVDFSDHVVPRLGGDLEQSEVDDACAARAAALGLHLSSRKEAL